jgi:hypothetical protein
MKSTLQISKLLLILLTVVVGIFISSCDDEDTETTPTLTAATVTDITSTTAKVTGEISNDGGPEIITSGFVYSNTNSLPTIEDNFTETTPTDDVITSNLEGLTPSTMYYVRAYAINSLGTGYGEVANFTTGNAAPVVSDVSITGTIQANEEVTVVYTYSDAENDAEGATIIQWYLADNAAGTGKTAIAGAISENYTIKLADEDKYISVGITPKSTTGTTDGEEVVFAASAPIGEATEITFMYNGVEVTYGILISPVTQGRWLDRNLGAPNVANAHNDFANYGDAFQWGRGADGHQVTTRAATSGGTIGVNGTEAALATSDSPGHNKFILTSADPFDWRNPQNDNLWQGVNGINNPCPEGFRIPTKEEWAAETLGIASEAYTQLKLTMGGHRLGSGNFSLTGNFGYYWSSSISPTTPTNAVFIRISPTLSPEETQEPRGMGQLCRCIKD